MEEQIEEPIEEQLEKIHKKKALVTKDQQTKEKQSLKESIHEADEGSEKKKACITLREHAEFRNCYTEESVKDDIAFLRMVYGDDLGLSLSDVNQGFRDKLKRLGKDLYFFLEALAKDISLENYIKLKFEFIQKSMPGKSSHMFFLSWNGLTKNDSFKRLAQQKFSLSPSNDLLCPKIIPPVGSTLTRYRTKLVLADDMAVESDGSRRHKGRLLDDGSGLIMREDIVWLPNQKAMPLFPQAYVPLNQTQIILVRHGKSVHESGGDNPEFVGGGYWDTWQNNRRGSGAMGNDLNPHGIESARELGRALKIVVDTLTKAGHALWSWSKSRPVLVYGSESPNTEQTARYFLQEAGYTNIVFHAAYGLNSQKYGALTRKSKKDIIEKTSKIYSKQWGGCDSEVRKRAKELFKNRFFHFPEGETLLEADWRIANSFIDRLKSNQGKRIVLVDHSGAIRVFAALIKTLDFADYCNLKEDQDSIIALCYESGQNVRYDYLQKKEFPLRSCLKKPSETISRNFETQL